MLKDFKRIQNDKAHNNDTGRLKEVNRTLSGHFPLSDTSPLHLQILGYLGEGTYAIVNLGHDKIRNHKVALKVFEKKTLVVARRLSNLLVS